MNDADTIDAYARAVVDGALPAGKYHRLSCARHLADRAREATVEFPYRFDTSKIARFCSFASKLRHYKGEWAKTPIVLEPYQRFRLGSLFGWIHTATGLRRFRTSYNELPRKQGKSLEAAIVALYATFFDGEPGAEGYTIATKRDQAKIVFADARQLVMTSGLRDRITAFSSNLHSDATASKLEPLGSDYDSTDGLNPHCVIVDEFHAHPNRGLIDVMETATGARQQPIIFQITTAGDDPVSPCGDQHEYACKILEGTITDETFFAFIAHADPEDDWRAESTWRKANPNYGISIKPDDLEALARKAIHMPAAANTFKQKRLNLWVNTSAPWLSMEGWQAGQSLDWTADDLLHEPCFVGIDLASKLDLTALIFAFPPAVGRPRWRLLSWVWTPADTLVERAHRDRAPYDVWTAAGYLRTTPGTRVDHTVIREVLRAQRERFDIQQIGFDPWHADLLIDALMNEDGFAKEQVIEVRQTYAGMSSGALKVEAEVLAGNVDAHGDPLLAWCAGNAVVQRDGKDNVYPVKKRSRGRIDPLMAFVIAMNLYVRMPPDRSPDYQIYVSQ
jgi:phage terminase large subunit-like protein